MLTVQKNTTGRIRFMHKDELKYVPLFGLYFWLHGCINVGRHGYFKETKSVKQLQHLQMKKVPTWLVLFPEGTRYNPGNEKVMERSRQFAENNGLKPLRNALSPRYRGTYLALRELHGYIDTVYDVTIAYESTRQYSPQNGKYSRANAPGMVGFILDRSPKMHMHIRRIHMSQVPHDSERGVMEWLHGLFEQKDRLLDDFINNGQFTEGDVHYQPVTRWSQTLPYNILLLSVTAAVLSFPMGRKIYTATALAGTLAGMIWMKFH